MMGWNTHALLIKCLILFVFSMFRGQPQLVTTLAPVLICVLLPLLHYCHPFIKLFVLIIE